MDRRRTGDVGQAGGEQNDIGFFQIELAEELKTRVGGLDMIGMLFQVGTQIADQAGIAFG